MKTWLVLIVFLTLQGFLMLLNTAYGERGWDKTGPGQTDCSIIQEDPNHPGFWYLVNNGQLYRSTDDGNTWMKTGIRFVEFLLIDRLTSNLYVFAVPVYGYAYTQSILVSRDLGEHFTKTGTIQDPYRAGLANPVLDSEQSGTLYAILNGEPAFSTNEGASWSPLAELPLESGDKIEECEVLSIYYESFINSPFVATEFLFTASVDMNCGGVAAPRSLMLISGNSRFHKILWTRKGASYSSLHADPNDPQAVFETDTLGFSRVTGNRVYRNETLKNVIKISSFPGQPSRLLLHNWTDWSDYIWISENQGKSWKKTWYGVNGSVNDFAITRRNEQEIMTATMGGIFRWSSIGWVDLGAGLDTKTDESIVLHVAQSRNRSVYVTVVNYRYAAYSLALYRSRNDGKTWNNITPSIHLDDTDYIRELRVDPNDASRVYLFTAHAAMVSKNAGQSWSHMERSFYDVAFNETRPGNVYLSAPSGIYLSMDSGHTRRRITAAPGTGPVTVSNNTPRTLFVLNRKYLFRSTDAGATFTDITPRWVYCNGCDPNLYPKMLTSLSTPGSYLLTTYYHELFKTTDGGEHWRFLRPPSYNTQACRYGVSCYPNIYASDDLHYYLLYEQDDIMETKDAGATWQRLRKEYQPCATGFEMTDPRNGLILLGTEYCGMLREDSQGAPRSSAARMKPDPGNLARIRELLQTIQQQTMWLTFGSLPHKQRNNE